MPVRSQASSRRPKPATIASTSSSASPNSSIDAVPPPKIAVSISATRSGVPQPMTLRRLASAQPSKQRPKPGRHARRRRPPAAARRARRRSGRSPDCARSAAAMRPGTPTCAPRHVAEARCAPQRRQDPGRPAPRYLALIRPSGGSACPAAIASNAPMPSTIASQKVRRNA